MANMKKAIIGLFVVLTIGLASGCSNASQSNSSNQLEAFIEGKTTREVVSILEDTVIGGEIIGFVRPNRIELSLVEAGDFEPLDTLYLYDSEDEFYVSIAPYIQFTHP